ncbi:MAG: DNA glycosylase AlkZ-like family protein [Nitriliruptorales bacterium]
MWTERTLVRTWAMRGTLHLLPSDELPAWVAALRVKERTARRGQAWERYHAITNDQLESITAAVGQVLGELPLTRAELGRKVAKVTGDASLADVVRTGCGGSILKSSAANGDLFFGPARAATSPSSTPRGGCPARGVTGPHRGAGVVVRRFLDAYGPATAADFARWWGVPPAAGKKLLRPLHDESRRGPPRRRLAPRKTEPEEPLSFMLPPYHPWQRECARLNQIGRLRPPEPITCYERWPEVLADVNDALVGPVEVFVETVTPALLNLADSTTSAHKLTTDVTLEAHNLVCGLIDADGLHTDDELWALITAFAPRLDTDLRRASPREVRLAGLVTGKRVWLDAPSLLFTTLVAADCRDGSDHAWAYYERAMAVAHTVASLDAHPSHAELVAIDRFRTLLLQTMANAGLTRSGAQNPATTMVTGPRDAPGATTTAAPTTATAPPRPLEELFAELDRLVGLAPVKAEVRLVANLIRVRNLRRERGLKVPEMSHHLVFTGNPGTGKTTVARLLAEIYRTLGVVERGHLVETDRSQLVAGYVGQTAQRVRDAFDTADEGVLLIDEAYALVRGGEEDFGREAIDMIVKLVEDRRDRVVVIVAGYPDEMAAFIAANPGLRSRFPKTIHFPDYTTDELVAIFELLAGQAQYRCDPEAREQVRRYLEGQPRGRGFGNGRLARNLFEQTISRQASRIVELAHPSNDELMAITVADVPH